jgi:hypothetical protein
MVDLGQHGRRRIRAGIEPHHRALAAEDASRTPDRAVGRIGHHRIQTGHNALVFRGINFVLGPDITFVALAVAIGVQDHRAPALGRSDIAACQELLGVEPADDGASTTGPQDTLLVELEMMRCEAGFDHGVRFGLGVVHR